MGNSVGGGEREREEERIARKDTNITNWQVHVGKKKGGRRSGHVENGWISGSVFAYGFPFCLSLLLPVGPMGLEMGGNLEIGGKKRIERRSRRRVQPISPSDFRC